AAKLDRHEVLLKMLLAEKDREERRIRAEGNLVEEILTHYSQKDGKFFNPDHNRTYDSDHIVSNILNYIDAEKRDAYVQGDPVLARELEAKLNLAIQTVMQIREKYGKAMANRIILYARELDDIILWANWMGDETEFRSKYAELTGAYDGTAAEIDLGRDPSAPRAGTPEPPPAVPNAQLDAARSNADFETNHDAAREAIQRDAETIRKRLFESESPLSERELASENDLLQELLREIDRRFIKMGKPISQDWLRLRTELSGLVEKTAEPISYDVARHSERTSDRATALNARLADIENRMPRKPDTDTTTTWVIDPAKEAAGKAELDALRLEVESDGELTDAAREELLARIDLAGDLRLKERVREIDMRLSQPQILDEAEWKTIRKELADLLRPTPARPELRGHLKKRIQGMLKTLTLEYQDYAVLWIDRRIETIANSVEADARSLDFTNAAAMAEFKKRLEDTWNNVEFKKLEDQVKALDPKILKRYEELHKTKGGKGTSAADRLAELKNQIQDPMMAIMRAAISRIRDARSEITETVFDDPDAPAESQSLGFKAKRMTRAEYEALVKRIAKLAGLPAALKGTLATMAKDAFDQFSELLAGLGLDADAILSGTVPSPAEMDAAYALFSKNVEVAWVERVLGAPVLADKTAINGTEAAKATEADVRTALWGAVEGALLVEGLPKRGDTAWSGVQTALEPFLSTESKLKLQALRDAGKMTEYENALYFMLKGVLLATSMDLGKIDSMMTDLRKAIHQKRMTAIEAVLAKLQKGAPETDRRAAIDWILDNIDDSVDHLKSTHNLNAKCLENAYYKDGAIYLDTSHLPAGFPVRGRGTAVSTPFGRHQDYIRFTFMPQLAKPDVRTLHHEVVGHDYENLETEDYDRRIAGTLIDYDAMSNWKRRRGKKTGSQAALKAKFTPSESRSTATRASPEKLTRLRAWQNGTDTGIRPSSPCSGGRIWRTSWILRQGRCG
ncbi:MAG: hypothetical protein WC352_05835, partial [Candidatus Omnitrophota bacterium]